MKQLDVKILLGKCNLKCDYCRDSILPDRNIPSKVDHKLIEWLDELKESYDIICSFPESESLMFFDEIKKLINLYPQNIFHIETNGTLLTNEAVDFFNSQRMSIGISFDGHIASKAYRHYDCLEDHLDEILKINDLSILSAVTSKEYFIDAVKSISSFAGKYSDMHGYLPRWELFPIDIPTGVKFNNISEKDLSIIGNKISSCLSEFMLGENESIVGQMLTRYFLDLVASKNKKCFTYIDLAGNTYDSNRHPSQWLEIYQYEKALQCTECHLNNLCSGQIHTNERFRQNECDFKKSYYKPLADFYKLLK